jgi:hypothetical protein
MATIVFYDKEKIREFLIFRVEMDALQLTMRDVKKRLEAFGFQMIGSIVETIDEHFSKDTTPIEDDAQYH